MALSVGLDVGTHHVRAVALRGNTVAAHAAVPRRAEDGTERSLATVIAELATALPLASPGAVASSELDVLARFLHVAPLPPARMDRIIRLELSNDDGVPPTIDRVRLAVEGDDLCYLGLVVDTSAVRLLQTELARGGVKPQTISWGPLALAAAAARVPLDEGQLALVVDIGASGTDVALVGAGRLLACRRLAYGGDQFSQVLIESGLSQADAERAKRSAAPILPATATRPIIPSAAAPLAPVILPEAPPADAGLQIDDGLSLDLPPASPAPPAPVPQAELELELDDEPAAALKSPGVTTVKMASLTLGPHLTRAAEGFYGQLATTLAFFKAQLKRSELVPARILICGGGSGLVALETYLERRFQAPVSRWDPFAGMDGAPTAEPWLWARAYGLAVQASPADVPRVDLRPEVDLKRQAWRTRLVWPWVAAACFLAAGVLAALALSEQVERDATEADLLERAVAEHKRLSDDLLKLEAARDAAREDLRAIAGRIYAARDLLWTVQALKEQTTQSKELWVTSLQTVGVGRDDGESAPTPSGGSRLSSGKPVVARKDSLIDRGAVDIAGRIRFDLKKTDPQMVAFRERYQQALSDWTTPDGGHLFRDVRLTNTKVERFERPGSTAAADAGEFPFRFRCYFQLTSLDSDVATTQASSQPAASPPSATTPVPADAPTAEVEAAPVPAAPIEALPKPAVEAAPAPEVAP